MPRLTGGIRDGDIQFFAERPSVGCLNSPDGLELLLLIVASSDHGVEPGVKHLGYIVQCHDDLGGFFVEQSLLIVAAGCDFRPTIVSTWPNRPTLS